MPAFTIVTITWNNLEGLRKTAASIQAQTFRDFEWLVIDGASTDGTVEAAERSEFPRATFVSEPDEGLYDAMNKGLERATGEFIVFMNAGDAFAGPSVLQDVTSHEAFTHAALMYGDAYEVDGEKRIFKGAFHHRSAPYTMFTHHQAIFYRRTAVGDLRYDLSYRIGADWVFTGSMLKRAKPAVRLRFPICNFERGGLSQGKDKKFVVEAYAERRRAMQELFAVPRPLVEVLVGIRHAVNVVRHRFPDLYDRLRSFL